MRPDRSGGFTLVELVLSLAIGALILAALGGIANLATSARETTVASGELQQQAQFALERIVRAVRATTRVLAPRPEITGTLYSESVRDVLVTTLDRGLDRDGDGFADADNDKDGRVDEDLSDDMTNDGLAGIAGVDDDGDGSVDESTRQDDDEDGATGPGEDGQDNADNDSDGLVDEDFHRDINQDGKPGVKDVDDDGDGSVDEGKREDDDEDGLVDEDWLDPVVYRLSGAVLLERLPDVNPANGNAFTERPIADGVTLFLVEYIPPVVAGRPAVLHIALTLTGPEGLTASLSTHVRVGTVP